jgi:ribosomal protein S18 acetylase RimI-like enzyme
MSFNDVAAVRLRRLTRADAQIYHSFRQTQLAATPDAFTSTAVEESLKPLSWAANRIAHPSRPFDFILGAFDTTEHLLGIAGLSVPQQRQAGHKGTLFGMAVASEARGRGFGRALVERVLQQATHGGLLQVILTVSEGNGAAEHLYRSCGFVAFGREPRAVIVDGRFVAKLHMIRMLDGGPTD